MKKILEIIGIIPEAKQVVIVRGKESYGYVTDVNYAKSEFTAFYVGEPDIAGPSITDDILPWTKITGLVICPKEIADFSEEVKGISH